ncbi:MAG TPA: hypothetical protein VG965_00910 [Patescibacteria group bacterium]|nr:hypothetical protein [Patescibacteria group bacterium]
MSSKKSSSAITVTFPNPVEILIDNIDTAKIKFSELLFTFYNSARQEGEAAGKFLSRASLPKFDKKKSLQVAIPVFVVIILVIGIVSVFKKSPNQAVAGVQTSNVTAVKTEDINREFKFPLKDDKGKSIGEFTYRIVSAEYRHQIVVKGQTATSVQGRGFLIINIELVNSMSQGLSINTRDYIRISVNNNDKQWFAPDIHNDPVEAQAISTKETRVGLAINDSDRDIKLQIGEIDGKKTIVPVEFK